MNVMNRAANISEIRRVRIAPDAGDLEVGRAVLLSGAAARVVDHPNGRSAALELFAAPTLVDVDPCGGRLVALGKCSFVHECQLTIEQMSCLETLSSEQALIRGAWMKVLLFEPMSARIAYLLLLLASAYQNRSIIPVELSDERIAKLCGVTERWVDCVMAAWVRSGVVAASVEGYSVRDASTLSRALGDWGDELDFDALQTRRALVCFA
jgi:hypothetical protein